MRSSRLRFVATLSLACTAALAWPEPARAWDPSTTHQGLLEQAVVRSAMHRRWMDGSDMTRGVFTALRVDPRRLDEAERLLVTQVQFHAHADTGAQALGGPGACPSATAPAETQAFCVRGDEWELPALGWIRLGILAEVVPVARHTHHFLDRADPGSSTWSDRELPRLVVRSRETSQNGEPVAGLVGATNFAGRANSALGWLEDANDPLAPARMFHHLERASLAHERTTRDHHFAMALVCLGALLHVAQDLAVPAHARGDATAFFARLSPVPSDRGLPFQEWTRVEFGRRDLPLPDLGLNATGQPLATSLAAHLIGEPGGYEGIGRLAGARFFSESSVPPPTFVDDDLSASEAARLLLRDTTLAPEEREGATLGPWPSDSGYLFSPTGRVLAAFDTDEAGRIRTYLDAACYREMASQLLPAAVDVSRSLLDFVWPGVDLADLDDGSGAIDVPARLRNARLVVLHERRDGARVQKQEVPLVAARTTTVTLDLGDPENVSTIAVFLADRPDGSRVVVERKVGARESAQTASPATPDAPEAAGEVE